VDWREKMTDAARLIQNTKQWLNDNQRWHLFSIAEEPIKHMVQELVPDLSPNVPSQGVPRKQ
jgi:hypothetical protein